MAPFTLRLCLNLTLPSSSPSSPPSPLHIKTPIPKPPLNPLPKTRIFSISRISLHKTFSHSPHQNPPHKDQERLQLAEEAVREFLEEAAGASSEEAARISLNCPKYLDMLVDGVLDIEDWNSWAGLEASNGAHDFKKKVCLMLEGRGDKGILPFLESVGLSLASATRLARYLAASNGLSDVMRKVECVREMFFSGSDDDHGVIGRNARRVMAHLSISADDDVQQTLAFFEKIQARRGGLKLLGSEQASLRYLIESFPRLLFLPLESRAKPILKFLEDVGVPNEYIRNVLLLFPPLLFCDIDKDIKPRLLLYEKLCGRDNIGKMLIKYPWILSTCVMENSEKVVDFFDEEKIPQICSSEAIKSWPLLLGCSVDKLKVMMAQLGELGISHKQLGQVIARSPQLLLRKPLEIVQVVSFFRDLGLDEDAIAKTLVRCPEIFAANIDNTLKKKLEFLSGVGISKTHIPKVVRKYPELFVCDVNRALRPRIKYLMNIGLSKKEVAFMVRGFSPLLGYSVDDVLRPKVEFLVKTMEKPLTAVVEYPRYFSYSLEKKIKPRYWVLRRRNIEFSLKEMLGKNDEEFAAEYLGVEGEVLVPPS